MDTVVVLPDGLKLSCSQTGDPAGLPVVMVPGTTDSWHSYEQVLNAFPPSLRAVAVSARGQGESDKPDAGYEITDHAGDVVGLLDSLGIERAVLVGHSGSCLALRRVAIDHPSRVAGLVLEASPSTLKDHPVLVEMVPELRGLVDPVDREFVHAFVSDTSAPDLPPPVIDAMVEEVLRLPARVWVQLFEPMLRYDDRAELGSVDTPVLLVWGDADPLIDRAMQDELLGLLPDADLKVYAGAAHAPRLTHAAEFADDVAAFVARCSSAG